MNRVKADLLPRIAQKWGQDSCFYKAPFLGTRDQMGQYPAGPLQADEPYQGL